MQLNKIHHIAIICSNYTKSQKNSIPKYWIWKSLKETFRAARQFLQTGFESER